MNFKNAALAACLLVAPAFGQAPTSTPAPAVAPPPLAAPLPPTVDPAIIDAALTRMVNDQKIIGVSALVFERGREVYFGAFGLADRENNKPFARDTVAQIFSMTKPVTGVALMRLYERGKFQLDDPLANHLPEYASVRVFAGLEANGEPKFEPPKRPITVRDILRHTAGFTGEPDDSPVGRLYREADLRGGFSNALPQVSEKLAAVPLAYQPGTRWLYSDAVRQTMSSFDLH